MSKPPMLAADGQPEPELYREDKLHLTAEGYRVWKTLLEPAIQKATHPVQRLFRGSCSLDLWERTGSACGLPLYDLWPESPYLRRPQAFQKLQ